MESSSLLQHFCQYFELRPARTLLDKQKAYHLRYQVYCEEFGFKNPADYDEQLETDIFDEKAEHVILIHKATGLTVGCLRLVFADPGLNPIGLPIQHYCHNAVDPRLFDFTQQESCRYAEVSRLAVHQAFRRRTNEKMTPSAVGKTDFESLSKEREFPHIPLSMFLAASALGETHGLDYVVVMMEPRLARLLKLCGIHFQAIGNVIDYHGLRAPFITYADQLRMFLTTDARELLEHFCQQFNSFQQESHHPIGLSYGAAL